MSDLVERIALAIHAAEYGTEYGNGTPMTVGEWEWPIIRAQARAAINVLSTPTDNSIADDTCPPPIQTKDIEDRLARIGGESLKIDKMHPYVQIAADATYAIWERDEEIAKLRARLDCVARQESGFSVNGPIKAKDKHDG